MVKLKCVVKITKILKKSYANMFSDIKEGDKIISNSILITTNKKR